MPASSTRKKPPAKKAAPRKRVAPVKAVAPAQPDQYGSGWAKGTSVEAGEDLLLPSGSIARVRSTMGMHGMVAAGLVDDMDSLTSMVQSKAATKKMTAVEKQAMARKVQNDKGAMAEGLRLVDRVVCYAVLEPKVHPELTAEEIAERINQGLPPVDPSLIYVSGVDETDKMFIFNFATEGQRDLEQFRRGLQEAMGGLE